jgi:hypothetical protein
MLGADVTIAAKIYELVQVLDILEGWRCFVLHHQHTPVYCLGLQAPVLALI